MAKWTIYWSEYASDTYLYGSEVLFHKKDDVEFRNELMPPGTIIKQWYSKTNFQMQKIEPALPMIDGESKYRISFEVEKDDEENCLARLVFYDRYENEAGSLTLRDRVTEFQCPLKTYSYRLQLINGGVTHFHFHSVVIEEITNETEKKDSKTK
ncbi:MAG: accessory Sec system protein Asp3 [Lachnospiraceae bacterium]